MSYKFELEHSWSHCPVSWKNFISSLDHQPGENGVSIETINGALQPYDANYVKMGDINGPYVEFRDEADLLMFILKYTT